MATAAGTETELADSDYRGDGPPESVIAESRAARLGDLPGITSWRPGASAVRLTPDGT